MAQSKEISWSEEAYTTKQLLEKFAAKFPLIVMVTRGYYGQDDIETLASNQVARIHTWDKQTRILARDIRGRYLSIPADYPIKFEVLEKKRKRAKPRRLVDILDNYNLPITVQFETKTKYHFHVGSLRYTTTNFGALELQRTYVERFLKGNTIHEGVIDDKVMLVPLYVDVDVKIAKGLVKGTLGEFQALQEMYNRAVNHIKFDRIHGTRDIMLYPQDVDNIDKVIKHNAVTLAHTSINGTVPSHSVHSADHSAGSMVKLLPNMTLVLNISKDELETGSSHIHSSLRTGSITDHETDHRSVQSESDSETSTLSGPEIAHGHISKVQVIDSGVQTQTGNVVLLNLGHRPATLSDFRHRRGSHSSKANSEHATSQPGRRSKRTQTMDDPRADPSIDTLLRDGKIPGRPLSMPSLKRAASLDSLQDYYLTDTDASSVEHGPRRYRPRTVKPKSEHYGMTLHSDTKVLSQSAHNLGSLPEPEVPDGQGSMQRAILRPSKNVHFTPNSGGFKEVYLREGLQITVADHMPLQRSMSTYTRRPGVDRAARIAYATVSTSQPAALQEALPPARTNSLRSTTTGTSYSSSSAVEYPVNLATSVPVLQALPPASNVKVNEYSTAPANVFPTFEHKTSMQKPWDVRDQVESLRDSSDQVDASSMSDSESDIIYTGTLTLQRNKAGGLEPAIESMQKASASNSLYSAPPGEKGLNKEDNFIHQVRHNKAAKSFGTVVNPLSADFDQSEWADREWRRISQGALPDRYTQINIPIQFENGMTGMVNGLDSEIGEGSYKTHAYVSMDDFNRREERNKAKMDINGNEAMTSLDPTEHVSPDGTVIRQVVIPSRQLPVLNGAAHAPDSGPQRMDADEVMDTLLSQNIQVNGPAQPPTNLVRSGSANSLRELYNDQKTPPAVRRRRPKHMAVAPGTEELTDLLNKPANQNGGVVTNGNAAPSGGEELENIRDSIRALDLYLKTQATDTDSQSQSSVGSKAIDKFGGYALTNEVTEL